MPWKKTDTGIVHFVSGEAGKWTDLVCQETLISSTTLLELAQFGAVYLNDVRIDQDCEIRDQDYLRLHTNPRRFPRLDLTQKIVLETESLLIVNKPAGLPCHPTVDNLKENLWHDLERQLQMKLFTTHRLDVPTSGLLVLTKTSEAQIEFQKLLKEKQVQKIYQAVVASPGPELGLHEHYMEKTRYAPKTVSDRQRPQTQVCQLEILKKMDFGEKTLLEIQLITGRTHQIRAQLAYLGFPIEGDSLYADLSSRIQDVEIQLRCVFLSFPWQGNLLEQSLGQSLAPS